VSGGGGGDSCRLAISAGDDWGLLLWESAADVAGWTCRLSPASDHAAEPYVVASRAIRSGTAGALLPRHLDSEVVGVSLSAGVGQPVGPPVRTDHAGDGKGQVRQPGLAAGGCGRHSPLSDSGGLADQACEARVPDGFVLVDDRDVPAFV